MSANHLKRRLPDPRLCLGCGACAYVCPDSQVVMADIDDIGLRPRFPADLTKDIVERTRVVCPVVSLDFGELKTRDDYVCAVDKKTETNWGAITGIWEGHAVDPEIRYKGSSGGALTALSQYCLERREFHAVLQTGENPEDPLRNATRLSSNRGELLACVGSRYAPASVCDGLDKVETANGPCVVIGKPVEIAATRNAMKMRPALAAKVGVTMSFFCAETPPTKATRSLMAVHKVPESGLKTLRYRGYGWPGYFTTRNDDEEPRQHWIYQKAWAYLQKFRPWGTHLWPDGSGELADISCGDPWYEEPDGENPGFSLLVARTQLGKEIIEDAIATGYLSARPADVWKLDQSQQGLLKKKGAVWGRRLVHRLVGLPNTDFKNLDLFSPWRDLSAKEKISSIAGTARRIYRRKLWRLR